MIHYVDRKILGLVEVM